MCRNVLVDNGADRKTTEDMLKYAAETTCNLRGYLKLLGCQCARTVFLNMLLRVSFNKIIIYVCLPSKNLSCHFGTTKLP